MQNVPLEKFRRRVLVLTLLRGGLVGLALGAWASCLLLLADWFILPGLPIAAILAPAGAGMLIGGIVAWLRRPSLEEVAKSLDRRLGLEDRVATALQHTGEGTEFRPLIEESAAAAVTEADPKKAFPLKWTGQMSHAFTSLLSLFLLAGLLTLQPWISPRERGSREALKAAIPEIERIKKETARTPLAKPDDQKDARRIAQELEKLQRQLEKERLSPKMAEAKAMQIADQLDELQKNQRKNLAERAEKIETAREKLLQEKADEMAAQMPASREALSPDDATRQAETGRSRSLNSELDRLSRQLSSALTAQEKREIEAQMANLKEELEQLRKLDEVRREAQDLQERLKGLKALESELLKRLGDPKLSQKERQELEAQLKQNRATQEELKQQLEELERAAKEIQELQKAMEELMSQEAFKELYELLQELQGQCNGQSSGSCKPLTKEDIEKMIEKIKELTELLKDDEAARELLDALREAIENGELSECNGGLPLLGALGLIPKWGPGGPGGEDFMLFDQGKVNTSGKNVEPKGETRVTAVRGTPRPEGGPSRYVEIKAPTFVGRRSSVPYSQVLPRYQQKADRAIERQQIPKRHQNRVRDYFDSIK